MPSNHIVLLPGLLCDEAVWTDQCAALRPFGDVQIPDYKDLDSIEAMARKVLDSVAPERFSLAGHSMGGRVALEVVRQAPERVQRLALLDTGYEPIAPGEAGEAERKKRLALLALARTEGMRAMGRQWAPGMVHPDRVGTPLFDEILDMIERRTPDQFEAQIKALLGRPDAAAVLRTLGCPTMLVCGRQDNWSPLPRHEAMLGLIPPGMGALRAVEECGHMSTMEQPQAVSDILRHWMTSGQKENQ